MATKERLEELIKQGATIWSNRFNKADKIKLYQDYDIYKNQLCTYNKKIRLNKLHESKEQAQWHIDNTFQRVERLELPTLEEFCNMDCKKVFIFYNKDKKYILEKSFDNKKIFLCYYTEEDLEYNGYDLFEKTLTKENYLEACRLVKKLFLGEEV